MSKESKIKLMNYLRWRVKYNKDEITYIELAKYMKINNRDAEKLIEKLYIDGFVFAYLKFQCINCRKIQSVKVIKKNNKIRCCADECGTEYQMTEMPPKTEIIYKINEDSLNEARKGSHNTGLKVINGRMVDKKVRVFMSYAHEDEEYKDELDKHLAVQKRAGKIDTWQDRKLIAGSSIHEEIDKELMSADVIILLLSSDFFASDYCFETEMTKALEKNQKGENIIIPVIVRDCDWIDSPIGGITALPKDGKSIASFDDRDAAYMQIVAGIKSAIQEV